MKITTTVPPRQEFTTILELDQEEAFGILALMGSFNRNDLEQLLIKYNRSATSDMKIVNTEMTAQKIYGEWSPLSLALKKALK